MPRLEAIKQQTSLEVGEGLEWLIDSDEKDIERDIHRETWNRNLYRRQGIGLKPKKRWVFKEPQSSYYT